MKFIRKKLSALSESRKAIFVILTLSFIIKPMFDSHRYAIDAYSNDINKLGLSQNFGVCLRI